MECLQSRKYCEAIMDALAIYPIKEASQSKTRRLTEVIIKNGLKIYLKKCQLFRTDLQYMGNTIFIKDQRVCVKPLRNRLVAKLQPPITVKGCRSFAGMVNFLSMFCPELQKLLKPMYNLTRKGRHFIWDKEQHDAFKEIKHRLIKPPILHMPYTTGRFHLYSDASKYATGSELYQIQNGKHS